MEMENGRGTSPISVTEINSERPLADRTFKVYQENPFKSQNNEKIFCFKLL